MSSAARPRYVKRAGERHLELGLESAARTGSPIRSVVCIRPGKAKVLAERDRRSQRKPEFRRDRSVYSRGGGRGDAPDVRLSLGGARSRPPRGSRVPRDDNVRIKTAITEKARNSYAARGAVSRDRHLPSMQRSRQRLPAARRLLIRRSRAGAARPGGARPVPELPGGACRRRFGDGRHPAGRAWPARERGASRSASPVQKLRPVPNPIALRPSVRNGLRKERWLATGSVLEPANRIARSGTRACAATSASTPPAPFVQRWPTPEACASDVGSACQTRAGKPTLGSANESSLCRTEHPGQPDRE